MSTIAEHEAAQEREITRLTKSLIANREHLRDQFAMAALTGLLPKDNGRHIAPYTQDIKYTAGFAYEIADAMLAARLEAQEQTP